MEIIEGVVGVYKYFFIGSIVFVFGNEVSWIGVCVCYINLSSVYCVLCFILLNNSFEGKYWYNFWLNF